MILRIWHGYTTEANADIYEKMLTSEIFPEIAANAKLTEAHRNIKIKHLLMMSSGFDADTDNSDSPGFVGHWIMEDNWVEFALNLPMAFESGTKWVYTDVCAMLCSAIIQKVSGQPMDEFAKEHLFKPLGIREYYWYRNAKNITGGMGNLYISNYDFAKLGLLVLNQGKWGEQQVISADWIDQISTKRLNLSEDGSSSDYYYGYFWYIATDRIGDKVYECIFASGNGGNKLYIIPQEKMVISVQSSAYGRGYGHRRAYFIFESMLRAIK